MTCKAICNRLLLCIVASLLSMTGGAQVQPGMVGAQMPHLSASVTYATFDPANTTAYTLSSGNLHATVGGFNPNAYTQTTIGKSSGIVYGEITLLAVGSSSNGTKIGVTTGAGANETFFGTDGNVFNPAQFFPYSYSFTSGDIISIVANFNTNNIYFYLNGVSMVGAVPTTLSGVAMFLFVSNEFFSTTVTANFGQSPFTYYSSIQTALGLTISPGWF